MPPRAKSSSGRSDKSVSSGGATLGFEAKFRQATAEYKHVVLGLILLNYISDAFEAKRAELDAVRPKAEGPDPGLSGKIADPFSDEFEDSELGEIPNGSKVGILGGVHSLARLRDGLLGELISRGTAAI